MGTTAKRALWRAGRKIYHYARGEQLSGDMRRNGESHLQARVLTAIPASIPMQVFDIGGNAAAWTRSLLHLAGPHRCQPDKLRIDAFEPVPTTAATFEASVANLKGGECVHLHRLGLSDTAGHARIGILSSTGGTNSLYGSSEGEPMGGWVDIELTTLDSFCSENAFEHVHLAKCDTEGHDSKVILGARRMLGESRVDVIQFEYNHRWVMARAFLKDVFDFTAELPYHVARVDPKSLTVFDAWHPELERFFQSNYVLVHERALAWFDARRGRFNASNTFTADHL